MIVFDGTSFVITAPEKKSRGRRDRFAGFPLRQAPWRARAAHSSGAPRLLADEAATQPWPEPRLVREASRLYNLTTVSCGSTHCVALGRCNERIDLCGVCGGDDSTCFLGDREVAQALQMSAALESQAA